jgi:uncharacterized protein YukE
MPEIKMDMAMMADMKAACQKGSAAMDETLQDVQKILGMIDQGALVGTGAQRLSESLRGTLQGKVQILRDKFDELQGDLQHAVESMQQGDAQGAAAIK